MSTNASDLWPALRHFWHPVALAETVQDRPVLARLLSEPLALARLGGKIVAFKDLCIHRGTPLSLGWVEKGESLVCGYHGWTYAADGRCIRVPSLPSGSPIPPKARATAYWCEERYGFVWVCLDEPHAPIPELPEYADPTFKRYHVGPLTWACGSARAVENFVDQAHFAWVHEGLLGDRERPEIPGVTIERSDGELRFAFEDLPNPTQPLPHTRIYRLTRPFTVYQRKVREGDGKQEVFFYCSTPTAERECINFLWVMRNYELSAEEEEKRRELSRVIAIQDQVIVERQRPWELPLDLSAEMHLRGPDAVAIAYRRLLAELGVE